MAPAPSTASTSASTRSHTWCSDRHEQGSGQADAAQPSVAPRRGDEEHRHVEATAGGRSSESSSSPSSSAAPSSSPQGGCPARRFEADYELLGAVLGTGASGSVRQAKCRRTGRHVAVKSFRIKELPTKTLLNLEREVDVHSVMKHPHIVDLEAVYETEETVHIVMEVLSGGELFDRLLDSGRFPEEDAANVLVQLLRSVSYLHAQNVMHRDIKPENIMYCKKGGSEVKLIDFGFATRFERHRKVGQRCGTMQYVAPEVLTGQGYDERADLWSLGCVCYTLLTMKALYSGDDAEIQRKNRLGLIDWSRTFKTVSPEAQDFVRGLLRVDPVGRMTADQALRHPWLRRHAVDEAPGRRAEAAPRSGLTSGSQRRALPGLSSTLDRALGADKALATGRAPREQAAPPQQQRLPQVQEQQLATPPQVEEACASWGAPMCFAGMVKLIAPSKGESETRSLAISLVQRFVALALDSAAASK